MSYTSYLQLPGIKGDLSVTPYRGWIELLRSGWNEVAKNKYELRCTCNTFAESQKLPDYVINDTKIAQATLMLLKNGVPYYRIRMTDVRVTSYRYRGTEEGAIVFTLSFGDVEWAYLPVMG